MSVDGPTRRVADDINMMPGIHWLNNSLVLLLV
eukprot:SAG31_NODE_912_length_11066_cov_4.092186_1_plen_33_part_00